MLEQVSTRFKNASWVNDTFVPDWDSFMNSTTSVVAPLIAEKACALLDTNKNCYTASWHLIWQQVKLWLLIQTPIFGASVLFEWLDLAQNKHIEKMRSFWDSSFAHSLAYGVQLVASLYACMAWIARAGALSLDPATWTIESLLMGLCAFNYVLRWLGAKHKCASRRFVYHVVRLSNLFDLLSIASHFSLATTPVHLHSSTS
ncbi:hypothetical protein SPRG_14760 [Saprolegnia parasitica CBS 223.65]|uniref:Uncharacterized protein n=1 Tax=Saprolegnia parasitica (strain CBS 223.65) TaxID=695850 RepID=A0A067BSB8_SAPPC|nr:hypothetical protein SPRG_14760 [Saprolegnia parasitica CBS 223.65]KDO19680.1 hypothetical protein SPRG_14760 [Saprolegnia parasitica CBS 223.65]|eukprot:XP_012209597.1 hypothetical protein SPRG_14760 [Saprolegnia parasitica CBS 223.65]